MMDGQCAVADSYFSSLLSPLYPLLSRAASPVRRRLGRAGRAMMDGQCAVADSYFSSLLSPFSFLSTPLYPLLSRAASPVRRRLGPIVCASSAERSQMRGGPRGCHDELRRRSRVTTTNYDYDQELRSRRRVTKYEVRATNPTA